MRFRPPCRKRSDADLLLHVVDASNPNFPEQMAEVQRVLARSVPTGAAGAGFQQADALASEQRPLQQVDHFDVDGVSVPRVFVSARSGEGLSQLRTLLANRAQSAMAGQLAPDYPDESDEGSA
jgi:GTP-binding protein HflX